MNKQMSLKLGGIKGEHCRKRIHDTLSDLEGISDVQVKAKENIVTIAYDSGIIAGGYIEETLQSLGYSIQEK